MERGDLAHANHLRSKVHHVLHAVAEHGEKLPTSELQELAAKREKLLDELRRLESMLPSR